MLHIDPAQTLIKTPSQVLQSVLIALNHYIEKNKQKIFINKSYRRDDIADIADSIYTFFKVKPELRTYWLYLKNASLKSVDEISALLVPRNMEIESESSQSVKFGYIIAKIKRRLANLSKGAYRRSELSDMLQEPLKEADLTLQHLTSIIDSQATDNMLMRFDYKTAIALGRASDALHCRIFGESASAHSFFRPTSPILIHRKLILYTKDIHEINSSKMNYVTMLSHCFRLPVLIEGGSSSFEISQVKFKAIMIKPHQADIDFLPNGKFLCISMQVCMRKQSNGTYKLDPDLIGQAVFYKGDKAYNELTTEPIAEYRVQFDMAKNGLVILPDGAPQLSGLST